MKIFKTLTFAAVAATLLFQPSITRADDHGQRADDHGQRADDHGQRADDHGQRGDNHGQRGDDTERGDGDHRDAEPFEATFHGFAEPPTPTDNPAVFEIVVPLQVTVKHLGKFDELLVHHINFLTYAFTGKAYWTAANGDTFTTVFTGQLYPVPGDPALLTFDVIHTVVGGTGRFKGATGSFNGVNGLYNLVTGEDLGGYLGTFSY